jgi:antitoxin component of MazEF toxin-antitoxin module
MATRVVRIGERFAIEIPEEITAQLSLAVGDRVEWNVNESGSAQFVKWTISDGLLEVEKRIAEKIRIDEQLRAQKRLAEMGDIDAQYFLGVTSKDSEEGAKWLRLAAEQGDRLSMRLLGHMLVYGDGIAKDTAEGYFWLMLSLCTYSLKSTKQERSRMSAERRELQRIGNSLTEDERKPIEERCRQWLDAHKLNKRFNPRL